MLFLNLNFPAAILLGKELLILLHFRLLDLDGLDLTSLERLLDALLCQLGRVLDVQGLKLLVACEASGSDPGQELGIDLK